MLPSFFIAAFDNMKAENERLQKALRRDKRRYERKLKALRKSLKEQNKKRVDLAKQCRELKKALPKPTKSSANCTVGMGIIDVPGTASSTVEPSAPPKKKRKKSSKKEKDTTTQIKTTQNESVVYDHAGYERQTAHNSEYDSSVFHGEERNTVGHRSQQNQLGHGSQYNAVTAPIRFHESGLVIGEQQNELSQSENNLVHVLSTMQAMQRVSDGTYQIAHP